ncbi:MAG TPA: hypothetical protein VK869_15265 [Rubrobacteraceae bacterium]|nr:hypothetical protein [Rubrobacteraceae bacterium]
MISVAELFAGVNGDEAEKSLKQLLLAFVTLPVTEKTARTGVLYRRDCGRSHGTGLADALSGAELVTLKRRHFPMLPRLVVPYER